MSALSMVQDEVDALHQASQVAEDMRTAAERTTSAQIKELEDAKRRLETQTATLENELAASKSSLEQAQSDAASAREAERSCKVSFVAAPHFAVWSFTPFPSPLCRPTWSRCVLT